MAGYRYWADEPGDDVMWFFSENHALMFHICQYFAGKSMPERVFTCSGLTGRRPPGKRRAAGCLVRKLFAEFATEWNSVPICPLMSWGLPV